MLLPATLDDLGGPSAASRAAWAEEAAGAARPLPRLVAWNLDRRCRAACDACALASGDAAPPPGELSTVESLHLAHQVVALNPGVLVLSGGDPLAREDVETIVAHARRRGGHVAISTPALRLTDRRLGTLQEAGVGALLVTLGAAAQAHGEGDPFDAAARARSRGFTVILKALVRDATRDTVTTLVARAADHGAHALHAEIAGEAETADRELAVQARRRAGRLAIRVARRGVPCACDPLSCRITADGKLTACPCAPLALADLRRDPFAAAWFQSPALVLRREAAHEPPAASDPPARQLGLRFGEPAAPAR